MPVKVHRKETGEVLDVPGAQAQQMLADGTGGLVDERVTIVRGDEVGTIESDDVPQALGQGFRVSDPEEADQIRVRKEERGTLGSLQGLGEAAASGASLGISDQLLTGLGADADRMRMRRDQLGDTADLAEMGGALLPLLASGGTAGAAMGGRTLGLGARALGAPVRGLEAAGLATERALARGALSRSVVPLAGRGAVEGVGYGVGQEISEAALEDRELSGERLMASGGLGAMFGLAGGAAFAGLGKIAQGVTKAPDRGMRKVLARYADGTEESTGLLSKTLGAAWGMEPRQVQKAMKKFARGDMADYFYRYPEMLDRHSGQIQRSVSDFKSVMDDAIRTTSGGAKIRRIEKMIPESANTRAPEQLADMLADLEERLVSAQRLNKEAGFSAYDAATIKEAHGTVRLAFKQLAETPNGKTAFRVAEEMKKQLQRKVNALTETIEGQRGVAVVTPSIKRTAMLLDGNKENPGIARSLRNYLGDENLFGDAALAHREIAMADADALSYMREHSKGNSVMKRLLDRNQDLSSRDAMLFVKKWGRQGSESMEEATNAYFDKQLHALRMRAKHYDLGPEGRAAVRKAEAAADKMGRTLEQQREAVDTLDVIGRLRTAEGGGSPSITLASTAGPAGLALLGSTMGPVGAAAGMLLGSVTRPYTTLRTLAGVTDIAQKAGLRIDGAVQRFAGKFGGKVSKPATRTAAAPSIGAIRKGTTKTAIAAMGQAERDKHLEDVKERAVAMSGSPAALQASLQDMMYEIENAAPGLAGELHRVGGRAAAYLASKAPKAYHQPFSGRPPVISRLEMLSFSRRVEATIYPIETLEQRLADGTLTAEHVEAFEEVWPALVTGVRQSIGEAVVDAQVSGRPIPREARQTLGRFFKVPIGPGGQVTLQESMAVYATDQAAPPNQQQSPSRRPRARKIDVARPYSTTSSRAEGGLRD